MKIRIKALAEQIFKAPVHFSYPTDEVDSKGNTVYGKASFVGRFRTVSHEEGLEQIKSINESRGGDTTDIVEIMIQHAQQMFIGFEPMPGEEFPLSDENDQPLQSSPETIREILHLVQIRDAVNQAYANARHPSLIVENQKK